ncbi:MAG: helix-turn-helix domain-containing protein [Nitrospira sp.]|nr:helix-turn-helix domain-containing protein [Nitrospira sp.]
MEDFLALQNKRLLRVDEAARLLNVSRWTIYRWVDAGQLGGTRIGAGSLRIFSDTVAALINHHCVGASVPAEAGQGGRASHETSGPSGRKRSVSGMVGPRRQAAL